MKEAKHSLLLNLSNQANTVRCKQTYLSQFNLVAILGLEYLNILKKMDNIPISFDIDKDGNLSINGLSEDIIKDENITIYIDKKVSKSE